jgi:DNA-binding protein HU-beta
MNSSELVQKIAEQADVSKAQVKAIVDEIFATIGDAAARGDEISIGGFGKFKVKSTAARQGRNPRTGDPMDIAAGKKLTFAPAVSLKQKLGR